MFVTVLLYNLNSLILQRDDDLLLGLLPVIDKLTVHYVAPFQHSHINEIDSSCEVGECGACTVIIDGETIDSCIYLAVWAEGKNIRTLEGLEKNGELTRIQEAFIEEGAIQCGFCTPGFIMSATVLLEHGEKLSRDAIRKHMAGNLCRCTGYENIVNAVEKVMDENETRRGKTVR